MSHVHVGSPLAYTRLHLSPAPFPPPSPSPFPLRLPLQSFSVSLPRPLLSVSHSTSPAPSPSPSVSLSRSRPPSVPLSLSSPAPSPSLSPLPVLYLSASLPLPLPLPLSLPLPPSLFLSFTRCLCIFLSLLLLPLSQSLIPSLTLTLPSSLLLPSLPPSLPSSLFLSLSPATPTLFFLPPFRSPLRSLKSPSGQMQSLQYQCNDLGRQRSLSFSVFTVPLSLPPPPPTLPQGGILRTLLRWQSTRGSKRSLVSWELSAFREISRRSSASFKLVCRFNLLPCPVCDRWAKTLRCSWWRLSLGAQQTSRASRCVRWSPVPMGGTCPGGWPIIPEGGLYWPVPTCVACTCPGGWPMRVANTVPSGGLYCTYTVPARGI